MGVGCHCENANTIPVAFISIPIAFPSTSPFPVPWESHWTYVSDCCSHAQLYTGGDVAADCLLYMLLLQLFRIPSAHPQLAAERETTADDGDATD